MLIAHISDFHIVEPGRDTYNVAPMADNLRRCIVHLNQLVPRPDVVLITGDIADNGSLQQTEHAKKILKNLEIPYFVIPGNHDTRDAVWSCFGGNICPARSGEFINYVIDGYDVCMIGLDTTSPGNSGGEFCEVRANWLDEQLVATNGKPVILFMHHPPVKCGVLETDEDGFAGVDLLADVVKRHINIERILCGHIHLAMHAQWCGTTISSAPSMGLKLGLDLTMKQPSEFFLNEPAYLLHYRNSDGLLITHNVSVRNMKGPYAFEDQ